MRLLLTESKAKFGLNFGFKLGLRPICIVTLPLHLWMSSTSCTSNNYALYSRITISSFHELYT